MSNDTDDTYYTDEALESMVSDTYQGIERGSYPELKPVDYNNINGAILTVDILDRAIDRATKADRKQAHTDPATE